VKTKEIRGYRETQLKRQKNVCPLCMKYIRKDQAALDHDHSDGRVRMVLHRNCNSVEGRVLHWAKRSGSDPKAFIRRLSEYWDEDYGGNPVHPTHKTDVDKKVAALRRRIRRAKRERTKQRLNDEIRRLREES
jgi:hypothetical protein